VKVSDTGHGISKENQSKIFKEIVQFHPEILQAGGGSGLGLWIVKVF
jgi:signal transduction histidine kinase